MKRPQIPETIRRRVREAAQERCGYCLSPQRFVMGTLEVEHLVPRARGGSDEEALKLNNELAVEVRRNWVLAGWHPPGAEE